MLSCNLQIFLRADDPDSMRMVRPADVLCIRLTRGTLEILSFRPNTGSHRTFICRGLNLFSLWTDFAGNRVHILRPGSDGIDTITDERAWSVATQALFPDPNPVADDCLLLETSTARDLWYRKHFEVFALRPGIGFLLQFRDGHAYVLTTHPGEYTTVRDALLASNLDQGTNNGFTPHPQHRYPAGSPVKPYRFATVDYKHRDLASEGTWETVIDNRPGTVGPTIGISP